MNRVRRSAAFAALAALLALPISTHATELVIPHTFSAGTPAVAGQVNANFAAIKAEADAKDARIAALEAQVATLMAAVSALQGSNVMALDPYLSLESIADPNDASTAYPTVRVSGANLQVVSGSGATDGAYNGLGNLIIGYNEVDAVFAPQVCSDGRWTSQLDCQANGALWARNHRSGSHNLVLGLFNAYSRHGGLVAARYNAITGNEASVLAGVYNHANGNYASVSGGSSSQASGLAASVSGGGFNIAEGERASVGGGEGNRASGELSAVSGGRANIAGGVMSTVGGGFGAQAPGDFDWAAGSLFEDQ